MRRMLNLSLVSGATIFGLFLMLAMADGPAKSAALPKVDALKHRSYSDTIPKTEVKYDMVAIPGGSFFMGSPPDEKGRHDDEGPQHPVTIRPFWMGKYEVTW